MTLSVYKWKEFWFEILSVYVGGVYIGATNICESSKLRSRCDFIIKLSRDEGREKILK
jgi:hypothetical protein